LIFGLVLGLTAGSGVAYLPELWDRSFRTRKAVRDKLNINAVWFIPVTSQYGFLRRCLHRLPGIFRHRSCGGKGKLNPDLFYGFDDARSPFSETLEAIKLVISRQMDQKKSKVIGVVSTFENERKELIAANLAYVASKTGAKTLLIDGNLRSDGLTALANAQDLPGLTEIATKSSSLESAIVNDQFSGFAFLPSGRKESIAFSGDLLASSSLKDFLTDTKNAYDFILLDLPPMGLYFDSEAIAPTLDAIILVVEWGKTAQNDVYDAFYEMPSVREKCIGVVLGVKNLGELCYYETIYSLRTHPKSRTTDKNLDRRSQVVSDNADIEMAKFDNRAA
jgi:succinoglycan biosynthesis transport protein ExoP